MEKPKDKRFEDLQDQLFHFLTVKQYAGLNGGRHAWWCECSCGNRCFIVRSNSLKSGGTKSCGCHKNTMAGNRNRTHGMSSNSEYKIWQCVIERCTNENNPRFKDYGGRGIKVCERWLESFENFYADMGTRPGPEYSIERKDNSGNYCPENCKWTTNEEQQNNTRRNTFITYDKESMTISQWSRKLNLKYMLIFERLYKLHWTVERALTTPPRKIQKWISKV